jgi:aspartyl aminopeptidase
MKADDSSKKSENELLSEKIMNSKKSSWLKFDEKKQNEIFEFAEKYKCFLKSSKTERLCVKNIISKLSDSGFKDISKFKSLKQGDKVFSVFKNKCVLACVVGKNQSTFQIVGSHLDSPRLDLKPNPLYEDSGLALLQTHYYGGIKKYHWVNTPLCLEGVIFTKDGKKVEVSIGQNDDDPVFLIPDLLPHLAKEQMKKESAKIVEGEELNIIIGNIPINDEKIKEQIKFSAMKYLNDKYGISEEDFVFAELELVPKSNPCDVGFDKSMIAAYGQDDKVCAYTSLVAITEIEKPSNTALSFFVDKEEIGSYGDTGAQSFILKRFADDYAKLCGLSENGLKILSESKAISADVTAGMNPNYKNVHDPANASFLGFGVSVEKYGGGGGKYSTHDAHAEYMAYLRNILIKNDISWQTGELGKIDIGGGGTIAMYMSRYGMDCVDAGPCVLGMHSPYELTSKVDIFSAYQFYKAFFNE